MRQLGDLLGEHLRGDIGDRRLVRGTGVSGAGKAGVLSAISSVTALFPGSVTTGYGARRLQQLDFGAQRLQLAPQARELAPDVVRRRLRGCGARVGSHCDTRERQHCPRTRPIAEHVCALPVGIVRGIITETRHDHAVGFRNNARRGVGAGIDYTRDSRV